MEICGAKVVVAAVTVVMAAMTMGMVSIMPMLVMAMVLLEQPCAHEVHDQPYDGDDHRLVEVDRLRAVEPYDAFPANQQGDEGEHHGACERRQVAELSGPEGEARIVRVTAMPEGRTDMERLLSGELVYNGARRTPLCAIAPTAPLRGGECPLAAELFATSRDLYLLTGDTPESADDRDTADGRPIKVRYIWTIADQNHARWEQAISYDDRTWETNWTAEFTRADAAAVCDSGRPRR